MANSQWRECRKAEVSSLRLAAKVRGSPMQGRRFYDGSEGRHRKVGGHRWCRSYIRVRNPPPEVPIPRLLRGKINGGLALDRVSRGSSFAGNRKLALTSQQSIAPIRGHDPEVPREQALVDCLCPDCPTLVSGLACYRNPKGPWWLRIGRRFGAGWSEGNSNIG